MENRDWMPATLLQIYWMPATLLKIYCNRRNFSLNIAYFFKNIKTTKHMRTTSNEVKNIERPTYPVHQKVVYGKTSNQEEILREKMLCRECSCRVNQNKWQKFLESILIILITSDRFNSVMLLFNCFKVFWSFLFLSF